VMGIVGARGFKSFAVAFAVAEAVLEAIGAGVVVVSSGRPAKARGAVILDMRVSNVL
jgi:hypothetical protein